MPFSPSVLHMIAAIGSSTTVRVLTAKTSSLVICVPFDCSISSSTPAGVCARTSNITSEGRENNGNLVDRVSIDALSLRSVTDPHDTIKEGQGQGQMAVTFAMGFSLVYTDRHTPYGCVTVLTVAYHSDEITRACSTYSTYSTKKPSDGVRARIEPMHITVSDTTPVSYASTVSTSSTASTRNGEVIDVRRVEVGRGVTVTEKRLQVDTFDNLGDSIIADDTRTKLDVSALEKNKADGGLFGFVLEEMTFALAGMFFNARQHVLLSQAWNVLQSDYLLPLNTSMSKSRGMFPGSSKNSPMGGGGGGGGIKNQSIDEAHRSIFPVEATAWIQSDAVKEMLLLMIRESTAAPLNFLSFLHCPLLLIAQALAHSECSEGLDSFLPAQLTATASTSTPHRSSQSDHTNDSNAGVFLRRLIYNLSCAFDNRCRCFIEESEKVCVIQAIKSIDPAVIGVEAGAGIEVGVGVGAGAGIGAEARAGAGVGGGVGAASPSLSEAETEADKKVQLSFKTSRNQVRGKTNDGAEQGSQSKPKTNDRNCTLHILVSLPLSSFNTLKGTNHTAIHICIPSLTSSATAPSTPSMKKRRDSLTDLSKKGKKSPVLRDLKNDALVFDKTHLRKNMKLPFIQLLECASEVGMKNECPESERIVEEERVQGFISAFVNVVLYTVSLDL